MAVGKRRGGKERGRRCGDASEGDGEELKAWARVLNMGREMLNSRVFYFSGIRKSSNEDQDVQEFGVSHNLATSLHQDLISYLVH